MIYGYARVSTKGQAKDGNSLETQEKELLARGCGVVVKEAYTGTKTDRPKFNELISSLEDGDTLMVTKLDRFARTAVDGVQKVESLLKHGIKVHILNMGLIEDTPMGKLILTTMLAFAEFERNMIVERTQSGKEIAKSKPGYREGRPELQVDGFDECFQLVQSGAMQVKQAIAQLGISRSSWYNLSLRNTGAMIVER